MVQKIYVYVFKFNHDGFKATAPTEQCANSCQKSKYEKIRSCTVQKGVSGVFGNLVSHVDGGEVNA